MATRSIRLNELAGSDNIARKLREIEENSDGTPSPAAFVLNLERPEPEDYLSNVLATVFPPDVQPTTDLWSTRRVG